MGFWDALNTAPSQSAALPSGPAGASTFWDNPTKRTTQLASTAPEVEDAPESPDNPFAYLGGMLKHVVTGVPDMIKGLWTLGSKTVEDGIALAEKAIPGTQGTEAAVEARGYNWANIVRAAPEMIRSDYAARYGFHGLDEMKDQIYANPLSYIMDALMVSGAAATGAKFAGKAGLMSDELVGAIRGIDPLVARSGRALEQAAKSGGGELADLAAASSKPTTEVGTLLGNTPQPITAFGSQVGDVAEGVMGISTNVSPLKRFIQNAVIKRVMTRSVESVREMGLERMGINPENVGLTKQATERLATAEERGLRIIKPGWEKFTETRAARAIAGFTKQEFYGLRNNMVMELRSKFEQMGYAAGAKSPELVKAIQGMDHFEEILHGMSIDALGLPKGDPIAINQGAIQMIPEGMMDVFPVSGDQDFRAGVLENVRRYFDNATGVANQGFNTPHSVIYKGEKGARFSALVPEIADAPTEIQRFAEQYGYRVMGVRDTLAERGAWKGLDYVLQDPQGRNFTVNVATQDLFRTQKLVSDINSHVMSLTGMSVGMQEEMAQIAMVRELLPEGMTAAEAEKTGILGGTDLDNLKRLEEIEKALPNIQEELDASTYQAQRLWDHPMRSLNHSYDGRSDSAELVDWLYGWTTQWNQIPMAKLWNADWVNKGLRGPFTVSINRAFMPMKLAVLHDFFRTGEKDITDLIKAGRANHDTTDDIAENIAQYLEQGFGQLPRKAVFDALFTWEDEDVAKAFFGASKRGEPVSGTKTLTRIREIGSGEGDMPYKAQMLPLDAEEAARRVVERLRNTTRMPLLKGEIDGELLDAWGWKNFAESTPQLPGYYPHIRPGNQGGLWFKGQPAMNPPVMKFGKGFKGFLEESGRVMDDPVRAYTLRAYQILRHHELMDEFEKLRDFGRELTEQEIALLQSGAKDILHGEKVFSPDYIKDKVSLHAQIMDQTHEYFMDDGMMYEDAAKQAIDDLNQQIQEGTTNWLEKGKVYALPNHVADQFKSGYLAGFSPAQMRMFWDKPKDLWIASVLGLNPRWFIYRMMGNIMFTGIHDAASIKRLFSWVDRKNNGVIEELLNDTETANGTVLSQMSRGYASAEMQRIGFMPGSPKKLGLPEGSGTRLREWGSTADAYPRLTARLDKIYNSKWGRPFRAVSRTTTSAVNVMEQAERRGIALGSLAKMTGKRLESNLNLVRRIAREGIDQPTLDRLIEDTNFVLGNYTNLSPIERDVIRRFLMPFYPFYRHMLKFATRMPWDHPLKSSVLNYLHMIDEDMGPHLPDYLGGAVYLGQLGGMPTYWNITHWNPLSELALPESTPITFVDPRIKMLIQAWTGTDEFMRPFHSPNVYEAPNGTQMIRTSSGWQVFEGIQHPSWSTMAKSLYGGPGSQFLNPYGYNQPWWKVAAGNAGFSFSQYDVMQNAMRELEAAQAAMNSPTAAKVPTTWD